MRDFDDEPDASTCEGCGEELAENEHRFCARCDDEWRVAHE
jgi:hypothetical protein